MHLPREFIFATHSPAVQAMGHLQNREKPPKKQFVLESLKML